MNEYQDKSELLEKLIESQELGIIHQKRRELDQKSKELELFEKADGLYKNDEKLSKLVDDLYRIKSNNEEVLTFLGCTSGLAGIVTLAIFSSFPLKEALLAFWTPWLPIIGLSFAIYKSNKIASNLKDEITNYLTEKLNADSNGSAPSKA